MDFFDKQFAWLQLSKMSGLFFHVRRQFIPLPFNLGNGINQREARHFDCYTDCETDDLQFSCACKSRLGLLIANYKPNRIGCNFIMSSEKEPKE